ncbi:MAG TPA: hypothetical protein VK131_06415, partial [Candidatus Acidoferrales bacterium]|nr:hypothetical protein [Candidatus Acidoferrales bacterium]
MLIPFALVLPAVAAYAYVDHQIHTPANPGTGKVRVVVPLGATFHETATILHQAGLVDSELVFDWYARYRHLDRSVEAGAYQMDHNWNMEQL